ncbi:CHAT domain-containing protein [Aquimarina algiphila]|uniref:CHAT domain-containing protein n=1 Tax=Aquimarina algiphila TaxID=2047982 RepID=UPI00232F309F|nr:CHAT domain-containing protein [Aquimarina algiphila]
MKKKQLVFLRYLIWAFFFIITFCVNAQTPKDLLIAHQYFKKADSLLVKRKTDSSIVYFKRSLVIYKKNRVWEKVAGCYNRISENQWRSKKNQKSIKNSKKALEICSNYLSEDHEEEANSLDNIAVYYENINEYDKALAYYEKALSIRQKIFKKDNLNIARSFINLGFFYKKVSDYKKALLYYKKALSIQQKIYPENDHTVMASYDNIGTIYRKISDYDKALIYHKKALVIRLKHLESDHVDIGLIYNQIGNVYLSIGKYEEALLNYKKDLEITIKNLGKEHYYAGLSYMNIGLIHNKLMKYNIAHDYFEKALLIFKREEDLQSILSVYNNIGTLLVEKGEYDNAIKYYSKSLDIAFKIYNENNPNIAAVYLNIGNTFHSKNNYLQALYYYKNALWIFKKVFGEKHYRIADVYDNIASILAYQKKYDVALEYRKKALFIRNNVFGENSPVVADSYGKMTDLYIDMGKYDESFLYAKKGLNILQNTYGKKHLLTLVFYQKIAAINYAKHEYDKAIFNYDKALIVNSKNKKINKIEKALSANEYYDLLKLLQILHGKAKTLLSQYLESKEYKYLKESVVLYENADIVINQIRQSYQNYNDKITFARRVKSIYADAIKVQLLAYRKKRNLEALNQAFFYAEKSKANVLKALLNDSYAKKIADLPSEIMKKMRTLKTSQVFFQGQIITELYNIDTDTTKIKEYESNLFNINRTQDSLTKIIEKKYSKYYQLKYQNNVIDVKEIQKQLDKKTTLIEFFTSDSITYVFTISKNEISVKELNNSEFKQSVEKFRESIISKDLPKYKIQAQYLYNIFLAPISNKLLGNELIIVPDGVLRYLNFELLLTQNDDSNNPALLSYLLKNYAVTYANSANLLFTPFKPNPKDEILQECLAFSFSDSTRSTNTGAIRLEELRSVRDDLPGTRREIKEISDIIDGEYYYGFEAIESNFKQKVSRYNIVHLALHGEVDNEHPENSKLYFTKGRDTLEDNRLYSHELFALDIPAELTVLSACNTGVGKMAHGEGIMSLGNAFQYAGTKSLLLTSWSVSDQTTPELMKFFYTNLKEGMNKAKALQQAKLQYLGSANINRLDPFYWGGFYLVGDSSPIPFKNNTTLYWVLGGIMFVILLFSFFWYRRKIKN